MMQQIEAMAKRPRWEILVAFIASFLTSCPVVVAQPAPTTLAHQSDFAQRLSQPHSAIVDGKEFRQALQLAARSSNPKDRSVNVWLDRKVNPNRRIYPGVLGPTRYASLCRIAEANECVCYPLNDCVLIGRPQWVDEMAARFFRLDQERGRSPKHDISWPDLTTPSEALAMVDRVSVSTPPARRVNPLPHDLWPAAALVQVDPATARFLITGQFLSATDSSTRYTRTYRFPSRVSTLKQLIEEADPQATTKTTTGSLQVTALAAAHRIVASTLLASTSGSTTASTGNDALTVLQADKRVFSLEVQRKPAGSVLQSLSKMANVEVQIDPQANPKLGQMVSFKAVDQSLLQLIQKVCKTVDCQIATTAEGALLVQASDATRLEE